jgi:hypothetical protein
MNSLDVAHWRYDKRGYSWSVSVATSTRWRTPTMTPPRSPKNLTECCSAQCCGDLLQALGRAHAQLADFTIPADDDHHEAAMLPDLELKIEDIASHATAHATTCTDCQLEVLKLLAQDRSPF